VSELTLGRAFGIESVGGGKIGISLASFGFLLLQLRINMQAIRRRYRIRIRGYFERYKKKLLATNSFFGRNGL
jgi:hypothetical protein